MDIAELLTLSVKHSASDLHLSAGVSPIIRVDGELQRLDFPILESKTLQTQLFGIMNDSQKKEYDEKLETDFSFEIDGLARFRVNMFHQIHGCAAVFRTIPRTIPTLEDLGLPQTFASICDAPHGLVLLTGPTGSGKTTTLAAMINYINQHKPYHVITIEDPVEFLHESKRSLINQRELNRETRSFGSALRAALREDPDIILVGEMRDLETIRLALTAAETGHLVFATLHTSSAAKSINRIIDVFPSGEKELIRSMLSESLNTVIAQILVKKIESGRTAALEIMQCTPAIRNLIREDKIAQIYSSIQTGAASGMQTLDQHLKELISKQIIDAEIAKRVAMNKGFL